jgi:hypothetical protein
LYAKIAGNNNVKGKELEGKRFVQNILARTIDSVKAIGYRQQVTTNYAQLLETIEAEPKLLYQGVTVNDKEVAINNANKLTDLLEINQRAVREGFAKAFAKFIYESGAPAQASDLPYMVNGLSYMISDNPYLANLYVYNLLRGGTAGDSQEFWRNRAGEWTKFADAAKTTPGTWPADKDAQGRALIDAMTMMLLVLNGVSEQAAMEKINPIVDGIYCNYFFYNLFMYAKYQLLHINNIAEQKVDVGFTANEHMGVPIYLDKNCPMNKIYFIDSSQIELLYVPGENFKHEVKEIPDRFAKQYITSFMGNFIIHKARNCGVITLNEVTNGLPGDCNVCLPDAYVDRDYTLPTDSVYADGLESTGYSGSGVRTGATTPPPTAKVTEKTAKK